MNEPPTVRAATTVTLIVASLLLIALSIVTVGCTSSPTEEAPVAAEQPASTAPSGPTEQRRVGQTLKADDFAIRVVSAGPANMPPEKGPPSEGNRYVAVRVSYVNEGTQEVALNGVPYGVYNTVLTVDGVDHPGALTSAGIRILRQGVVPPDTPLDLRFVFEVPERSQEATFVWAPAPHASDLPTLLVPLPSGSLAAP